MDTSDTHSALVIAVPEAEPVVGRHRAALDSSAAVGVPAHVTVLFPFLPPTAIDARVSAELTVLFAASPAFDCVFHELRWFGTDLLWLAPTPDDGFRALTDATHGRFPQCPPYGGKHSDAVPHLTVGDRHRADPDALRAAAAAIAPALPVRAQVREVHLLTGTTRPGSWTIHSRYQLRPAAP